jgi:hypothetical protein
MIILTSHREYRLPTPQRFGQPNRHAVDHQRVRATLGIDTGLGFSQTGSISSVYLAGWRSSRWARYCATSPTPSADVTSVAGSAADWHNRSARRRSAGVSAEGAGIGIRHLRHCDRCGTRLGLIWAAGWRPAHLESDLSSRTIGILAVPLAPARSSITAQGTSHCLTRLAWPPP